MTNHAFDLLLLTTNLSQLKDHNRVITLFIEGMNSIFPELVFSWHDTNNIGPNKSIEVCTKNGTYGFVACSGKLTTEEPEWAMIRNASQMLGIILEKLNQEQMLIEQNNVLETLAEERALLADKLELRVAERTADLEKAVTELAASRLAALTMMQEAVKAQQQAEKNAAILQQEITGRKQAEAEREKLQNQLLQAQKMESVGRLAGGVAHDFNNMLGVILGHAELALMQVTVGQPFYQDLEEIRQAAQRSADLTRQLLAFARKQTISPRVLDLNDTVAGMLKMLQRLIGEDISLVWRPEANLWSVKMDPTQIDQILVNLAVNARDAIAGVGSLVIETENVTLDAAYCLTHADTIPGNYVLLAVSDTGCGMDHDTLAHLFEPFFTTKEIGKGTGLGLATIYGILKQNNGSIGVYSEPGQGTTFRIYLPPYADTINLLPLNELTRASTGGPETILLVEDEPAILEMTKMMLEEFGYQVLVTSTPGEAIRLAKKHTRQIHLLLTDVVMPQMNGRDLAQQLLLSYPDLKQLFMSGYTANIIAHRGIVDEGISFIQKPFSMNDLAVKVRQVLDQRRLTT